jgi:4-hydroxy-2-oxoheptanedioate aldolase
VPRRGPGDLGLSLLGLTVLPRAPYPPVLAEARARIVPASRPSRVAFLKACTPETIVEQLGEGVRVIAAGQKETARIGRAHQRRAMPV